MIALARALALAVIMVIWSEVWFYPVTLRLDSWMIFLFYGLATIFPAFLLARFPNTGWPGVIVAAGLMGIAIEGVPVPVVYEAMPFTIVWTSLAWHGLVSFGVGVVGMRDRLSSKALDTQWSSYCGLWGGALLCFQSRWFSRLLVRLRCAVSSAAASGQVAWQRCLRTAFHGIDTLGCYLSRSLRQADMI